MTEESPLDKRWNAARQELVDAANTAGVDPGVLVKIAGFESGYNPHARPIAGHKHEELNTVTQFDGTKAMSSAYGYGQFLNATWTGMVRDHGEKYGVDNAASLTDEQINTAEMRNNTRLQAGVLAEFTKANADRGAAIGGSDPAANVYAMHNLGGGDGPRFLRAMAANPDARVDSVLSSTIIERNSSLYGDGSISLKSAYENMGAQMERYATYADQVSTSAQHVSTGELPTSPPVPAAHPHQAATPNDANGRTLRLGSHGEDVRQLQAELNRLGFRDGNGRPLTTDADFGPSTKTALEAFQAKSHLASDGVAGPNTLRHLSELAERDVKPSAAHDAKPMLSDTSHPGNSLFRQAFAGMQTIDAAQGRSSDQITERVAGAVAAESHARGLSRIDSIVLNDEATRCWAVQGQHNDPFKQLASVDLNRAVQTPLAESTMIWEQANAQRQMAGQQDQQQAQTQAQSQGPVMQR